MSSIPVTRPTRRPATWTSLSVTSCPALSNSSVYRCAAVPAQQEPGAGREDGAQGQQRQSAAGRHSIPSGPSASPARNCRTKLVVRVEQLRGGARLHDPPSPQHGDVLREAAGGHDVVGDDHVGAAVLLVHLLDQLAQQRRADGIQAGVGLVEEHDVRVEHERAREAGALAHAARELVGHLRARRLEPDLAQPPHDEVLDLVLALVRVLAQREGDVVVEVHRAEQRAVLEQDAEPLAHGEQLFVAHRRDGAAVHEHVALVGVEQADHVLDAARTCRCPRGPRIIEIRPSGRREVDAAEDAVAARTPCGRRRTPTRGARCQCSARQLSPRSAPAGSRPRTPGCPACRSGGPARG